MHGGDVWREGAPGDWLDFSANIRPGGPPEWVREALLAGIGDVSYYPDPRMERSRAALGKYLRLGADWVLPTAGGISAIALAMRLDAPEVILFGPCFGEYAEIAADCGTKARELSLLAEQEKPPKATPPTEPMRMTDSTRKPDEPCASPCGSAASATSTGALGYDCAPNESLVAPSSSVSQPASLRAPSNEREAGKPSAMPSESASSSAPTGALGYGSVPSKSLTDQRGSAFPSVPTGALDSLRISTGSSASPCDNAMFAAPMDAPGYDREPGESLTAPIGSATQSTPLRARCNEREAGGPCAMPSGSASPSMSMGALDSRRSPIEPCANPFDNVASSAPTGALGYDREPGGSLTAPIGSASQSTPLRARCNEREEGKTSTMPSGSAFSFAPSHAPNGLCVPMEQSLIPSGSASPSVPSRARGCGCRAELAAPSEVLRGNMSPGAAVWLCNPLNPVGVAFSRAEVEALLRQVEAAGGWLVLDEAFIHCCPERTSVDLLAKHPRLVIVGSLTKSLGIPGARAGYICANPELLRELARRQRSWELNCFAESVIRALPDHAAELRAEAARNAARREALRWGLEALGVRVYPSEACFLLADFGRAVSPIAERLRAKGILVRRCEDFHGIDDGRHLRLAVKDEAANARLLEALGEALGEGNG